MHVHDIVHQEHDGFFVSSLLRLSVLDQSKCPEKWCYLVQLSNFIWGAAGGPKYIFELSMMYKHHFWCLIESTSAPSSVCWCERLWARISVTSPWKKSHKNIYTSNDTHTRGVIQVVSTLHVPTLHGRNDLPISETWCVWCLHFCFSTAPMVVSRRL